MEYLGIAKDIAQIAFWLVAGAVAVFTYRQARRTVLQPIRTEVFKEQLKVMSEAMSLFVGKHELALRGDFDFNSLFDVNVCFLLDSYATNFFDVQFEPETRKYNSRDCPMRMGKAFMEALADPLGDVADSRAARWARYKTERLFINRQYCEMDQKITRLLENPLLPAKLANLLTQYLAVADQNRSILMELLAVVAKELPARFSTLQAMERIDPLDWPRELWNRYNHQFKHLKPLADEIVAFVRQYFEADSLKNL
ncbi:hypothetical protein SAMN05216428_11583 [Nitrosospira sp. Nsp11]|uniref:hypothetical protein n=1 Tax=Nitrosospira sp. Nsp11 TaxID=1855338 RepID=UPI00092186F9|nr:hypothetical protein [Nitrosospira sp. Nsp11]SHM15940.1 hypothetical protein SAMN05216428_11583 [Nitrosospira sp. Nsp11]